MTKILFILQCWALVPCLDIFVLIVSTPTRFPVSWPMKSPNYLEKAQPSRHTPTESLVLNIYVIQQPPRLRGGEDVYMAGSSLSPSKDENDQHQEDVEDEEEDADPADFFEDPLAPALLDPIDQSLLMDAYNDTSAPRSMLRSEYTNEMYLPPDGPLFPSYCASAHEQPPSPLQPPPLEDQLEAVMAGDAGSPEDPAFDSDLDLGPDAPDPDFEDPGPPGEDSGPGYEDLVVPDTVEGVPAAVRAAAYHSTSAAGALRRVVVRAGEHRWTEPLQLHAKWVMDIPPWCVHAGHTAAHRGRPYPHGRSGHRAAQIRCFSAHSPAARTRIPLSLCNGRHGRTAGASSALDTSTTARRPSSSRPSFRLSLPTPTPPPLPPCAGWCHGCGCAGRRAGRCCGARGRWGRDAAADWRRCSCCWTPAATPLSPRSVVAPALALTHATRKIGKGRRWAFRLASS